MNRIALILQILFTVICSNSDVFAQRPQIVAQRNHRGTISSLSFNESHDKLITTGHDGYIKIWRYPDYKLLKSIPTGFKISDAVYSHRDNILYTLSGSSQSVIVAYDGDNFVEIKRIILQIGRAGHKELSISSDSDELYFFEESHLGLRFAKINILANETVEDYILTNKNLHFLGFFNEDVLMSDSLQQNREILNIKNGIFDRKSYISSDEPSDDDFSRYINRSFRDRWLYLKIVLPKIKYIGGEIYSLRGGKETFLMKVDDPRKVTDVECNYDCSSVLVSYMSDGGKVNLREYKPLFEETIYELFSNNDNYRLLRNQFDSGSSTGTGMILKRFVNDSELLQKFFISKESVYFSPSNFKILKGQVPDHLSGLNNNHNQYMTLNAVNLYSKDTIFRYHLPYLKKIRDLTTKFSEDTKPSSFDIACNVQDSIIVVNDFCNNHIQIINLFTGEFMGALRTSIGIKAGDDIVSFHSDNGPCVVLSDPISTSNVGINQKNKNEHRLSIYNVSSLRNGKKYLPPSKFLEGHNSTVEQIGVSSDNKILASGDNEGYVILWETSTWQQLAKVKVSSAPISDIEMFLERDIDMHTFLVSTKDATLHRFLYVGGKIIRSWSRQSEDAYIDMLQTGKNTVFCTNSFGDHYIVNPVNGEPLMMFSSIDSSYFIYSIAEGYYTYSKNYSELFHFELNNQIVNLDVLDPIYNRPDYVLRSLGSKDSVLIGEFYRAAQIRMSIGNHASTIEELFKIPIPKILNLGKSRLKSYSQIQYYDLYIEDVRYGDSLIVSVNNRIAKIIPSSDTIEIDLLLNNGINHIEFYVKSINGRIGIKTTIKKIIKGAAKPKVYILGLNIFKFSNSILNLPNTSEDVNFIVEKFKENFRNKGMETKSLVLENYDINYDNMKMVNIEMSKLNPNDILIVYISSHGDTDEENKYKLLFSDYLSSNDQFISFEGLKKIMEETKSRNRLLILNTCNSGELVEDQDSYLKMQNHFFDTRDYNGLNVFSATNGKGNTFSVSGKTIFRMAIEKTDFNNNLVDYLTIIKTKMDKISREIDPLIDDKNLPNAELRYINILDDLSRMNNE